MSHEVSLDDPEVKRVTSNMIVTVAEQDDHPIDQMINYYSDYYRLKKAVAWLVRWVRDMRHDKDVNTGLLTLSELRNAECILVKRVQKVEYAAEIGLLCEGNPVKRRSHQRFGPGADEWATRSGWST